jgi:hypothetical protein
LTFIHRRREKGTNVTHLLGDSAKMPRPASGVFARLRGFLRPQGIGAPSARLGVLAVALALALVSLAPSPASAAFTRPFLRQLNISGAPAPFEPVGLALDAKESLWVSSREDHFWGSPSSQEPLFHLDSFESAQLGNAFLAPPLAIESPEANVTHTDSLAIDRSTGAFYLTGPEYWARVPKTTIGGGFVEVFDEAGAFVKQFGPSPGNRFLRPVRVAVDNSTESSAGSVYVSAGDGIGKFDSSGNQQEFSCLKEPGSTCSSYINANQITAPGSGRCSNGAFGSQGLQPNAIVVGPEANIYVADSFCSGPDGPNSPVVLEYRPSGEFLRLVTGAETPGLGESHTLGGFGGALEGLAVDPLNGHLLVSVNNGTYENYGFGGSEGAVDEFDSSGHFVSQILQASPGRPLANAAALAVDPQGDLYLAEPKKAGEGGAVDVYGPGHFLPTVRLAEATQRKPESAFLTGSIDPEGRPLTECVFQYVTEAAYKADIEIPGHDGFSDLSSGGSVQCTPKPGEIAADSAFHPVEARLEHLTSGATYRYRLAATSSGALSGTADSSVLAFTAPHPPLIDSTAVDGISSTSADFHARIRPLGADTTYRFQYLTEAEYRANLEAGEDGFSAAAGVPAPAADIGSGEPTGGEAAAVLQHVGGLAPATAYRFRVLAENELGATPGEEVTFLTLPPASPGLPDNRAYELLTPPNKGSAEDMFARPPANAEFRNIDTGYPSESGDGFLLETRAAFGPFPASFANAYVFSRAPSGWSYTSLASPQIGDVQSIGRSAFDPADLSRVATQDFVGSASGAAGATPESVLGPPGGPYTPLRLDSPVHNVLQLAETEIVGASRHLGLLVLESTNHTLAAGAKTLIEGASALYESAGAGECRSTSTNCALLSLNPQGKPFTCGAILGRDRYLGRRAGAVSADGSRIIFTAPDPYAQNKGAGCWNGATTNTPQLYLRSAGATVEVSAPSPAAPEATAHPAMYAGASADGSRVLFLSEAELTADDAGIHDLELYQWQAGGAGECGASSPAYNPASKGCLTRVSAGESGSAAAAVAFVPAISPDGSSVYFTAAGQLTPNAPKPGGEQVNLYRYDTAAAPAAATAYVATVSALDYPTADVEESASGGWLGDTALVPDANWYTTPDGRYLLFASQRELTPNANNAGTKCQVPGAQGSQGRCDPLYRYDAATATLTCISCNPSGAPPLSNALFARSPGGAPAGGPPRPSSNDGSRVFFDTADSLVPTDVNGTLDVYEWEADGAGSCHSQTGCLSLISSGHDSAPSFFLGASADGANVFFGTHARLVPADADTAGDLYDARICTSSDPCIQPPPGTTAQCEGDACHNPPAAPIDATPTSLTFSGAGNLLLQPPPPIVKPKTAAQLRAEELTRAVKACKKLKSKTKRRICERTAHKRFGPPKKAKKATRASNGRRASR